MSLKAAANSKLGTAVVTGSFALVIAVVTGVFNWLSRPAAVPAQPPPALAVATLADSALIAPAVPAAVPATPAPPAPNPILSFVAFQSRLKNPSLTTAERSSIVAPYLGRAVAWQGYVDEVIDMPAEHGGGWTVALCENREVLEQTLFKQPALCRFPTNAGAQLASLQRGQRIAVTGTLRDHNIVATEVVGCTLLNAYDD